MFPCCFSADKKLRKIWGHWKWPTKARLSIGRCTMRSLRISGSKPGNREVVSHYFVRFLNDKYIDLKKYVNNARNRWVIIGSHIIDAGVCRNRPGCAILPRRSIFALGGSSAKLSHLGRGKPLLSTLLCFFCLHFTVLYYTQCLIIDIWTCNRLLNSDRRL